MSKKKFKDPGFTINRVYTKKGDAGETSLIGGKIVSKDHPRIISYGELDELNSYIGGCRERLLHYLYKVPDFNRLEDSLLRVQNELFNIGTMLATDSEKKWDGMPVITKSELKFLEIDIDYANADFPALASFVLPGGNDINIWFHLSRSICRRVERHCVSLSKIENLDPIIVQYLNRLSDALFVWGRWANLKLGDKEQLWEPNNTSSGKDKKKG